MVNHKELQKWCLIKPEELEGHSELKVPFKLVENSELMGTEMAREFIETIDENNRNENRNGR